MKIYVTSKLTVSDRQLFILESKIFNKNNIKIEIIKFFNPKEKC